MANRIVLNTISYHGSGAVAEIGNELSARGYKRAFIASGRHVVKSGEIKKITDVLDEKVAHHVLRYEQKRVSSAHSYVWCCSELTHCRKPKGRCASRAEDWSYDHSHTVASYKLAKPRR